MLGITDLGEKQYYTFMASPKIPWDRLWSRLRKMIPEPETYGRLAVALDNYINPKNGKRAGGFKCCPGFVQTTLSSACLKHRREKGRGVQGNMANFIPSISPVTL